MRVFLSLALAAGTVALWRYWLLGLTVRELPGESVEAWRQCSIRSDWRM